MSQPITHYCVAKNAFLQAAPELMAQYEAFVGFGSFGPDLFYLTKQSHYADLIHGRGSLDAFCTMIDRVKTNWSSDADTSGKQLGFALGFYAHVITDCVFHPYVYRLSGDYWKVPKPAELQRFEKKHKTVEAAIDHDLLESVIHPALRSGFKVKCGDELDFAVSSLLNEAMNSVYGADLGTDFQANSPDNQNHLIQVAYSRFVLGIPTLYGAQNILYRVDEILDSVGKLARVSKGEIDLLARPWPPGGYSSEIQLTFVDLYERAVTAVKSIVEPVYEYLGYEEPLNAREFFKERGGSHLQENWNLDTGMPQEWNARDALFVQDNSRYDVGVKEILLPMYGLL